ncbi:unnamed protein product [Rotaria sp. Silwood2]|nr:unnamed protein product [Rotaria sp. Silwood2]CAF2823546.1 unnamed protein product [Rotaria sp. Silwood2]CAF3275572.1 unnamed protein product [Rotaria sp. Silwood2]CAF3275576.1 unnamed protein product [Rotaria sp. Silwood2]CAF4120184.1 unnamed protein product [Rotaria sp. Silwood2]
MASSDPAKSIFDEIDTNQDGKIDKDEFRKWASIPVEVRSSPYERPNTDFNHSHTATSRLDRYEHKDINQNAFESTANQYSLYGTTTVAKDYISDTAILTKSVEETELYLENHGIDLCKNPEIIRRTIPERPSTYEQRVFVRYLQPPALPPAGPLIIKEVRAEQPPPLPPLIIREQAPPLSSPPPLILRERPPTPPPILPSETITRTLPPLPAPSRSVVIERYPPLPEKPRDIIIERWIPYGRQIERRTIVEKAPLVIEYPRASCTVVIYEAPQARIVRKFEQLGVTNESPEDYVGRYRGSLLDSGTLVQQARNVGVIEDITPPILSLSVSAKIRQGNSDFHQSNEIISEGFSYSGANSSERIELDRGSNAITYGTKTEKYSASNRIGDSVLTGSTSVTRREYQADDGSITTTYINRDGKLHQTEVHEYI